MQAIVNDISGAVGDQFRPKPHQQIGDGDSAHQVLFGEFDFSGPVAVKPHSRESKAAHELRHLEAVAERGVETVEPLGLASGALATYLVTQRRDGLRHQGQIDWGVGIASRALGKIIIPTLRDTVEFVDHLNEHDVIHGDFQPKNVVFDIGSGVPVALDLERAAVDRSQSEHDRRLEDDLERYGGIVLGRGLLSDRTPQYRASWLRDQLVDPVYSARSKDSDHQGELGISAEKIAAKWGKASERTEIRNRLAGRGARRSVWRGPAKTSKIA